jgi:mannose-6-phosphate isomerase
MRPVRLVADQPPSTFRGGDRIRAFRGLPPLADPYRAQDWIASVTGPAVCSPSGPARAGTGLTVLPDGRVLRDALRADPLGWFGVEHARRFGADPRLQLRLVDTAERLPLHVHAAGTAFAPRLQIPASGTTAWVVLSAEPDAAVHLGFRRPVAAEELTEWVRDDKVETMLAETHRVPVRAGDGVIVPAGLPHAVGPGVLLVALRESAVLTVPLEGVPDVDEPAPTSSQLAGHGPARAVELDLAAALSAVDRRALDDDLAALLRRPVAGPGEWQDPGPGPSTESALPSGRHPFGAEWVRARPRVRLGAAFSVVFVLTGNGLLVWEDAVEPMELDAGDTVLVPHSAGVCLLEGPLTALRCHADGA